jgi:hypothetical protein
MRLILASAAAAGLTGLLTLSPVGMAQSDSNSAGSGSNETNATAASCRPLTASNRDVCCNAPNWSELISSDDAAYCPSTGASDTVRLGREFPDADGSGNNQLETGSGTDSTSGETGSGSDRGGNNSSGGSTGN